MSGYSRVGILGGGQLGRMLALAGTRLGIGCLVFDPHVDACAGQVTQHLLGDYGDAQALRLFAHSVRIATYEFESIPPGAVREIAGIVPVLPSGEALEVAGDRVREKELFSRLGIPTVRWRGVSSRDELLGAGHAVGYPQILKSRSCGYDGKGQASVNDAGAAELAWQSLGWGPCVAESRIRFDRELSLVAVRGLSGETAFYPLVENLHEAGVLRTTLAPAPAITAELQSRAEDYARRLLEALDYVGVLTLELFQQGEELLANELAPRVHNSGHWTIEGAVTSQFENHLRAITGRPLGSTKPLGCAAMVNLLGTVPPAEGVRSLPGAHLHHYGKLPAPGRKLGHVTVTAPDPKTLAVRLQRLRSHLSDLPVPEPGLGGEAAHELTRPVSPAHF